tara:strand:- start:1513 stop:2298 length:786 start_codon:yes stop_codon:yes gene_type:complete
MKTHQYDFDTIVVGGTYSAVAYCYNNKLPILFVEPSPPHFFEKNEDGSSKLEKYRKLLFLLSLEGLVPLSDKVRSIRIEDNILNIITKTSRIILFRFKKIRLFDEQGIIGLGLPHKKQKHRYEAIDWFDVRSGMCHKHHLLESESDFVRRIHFYPSERIDGNHDKKDFVAISYLTEEQVNDIEYSEIYAKFKSLHLMREAGIVGAKNGSSQKTGNNRYNPLKIEPSHREINKLTRDLYKDTENMIFDYSEYEVYEDRKTEH